MTEHRGLIGLDWRVAVRANVDGWGDAKLGQHAPCAGESDVARPFGRRQKVAVRGLAEQHMKKADAKGLYEDLTPKPTAEEIELRRIARMVAPFTRPASAGAPDKRERRALRRLKGRS